jgi:hypothetical protein
MPAYSDYWLELYSQSAVHMYSYSVATRIAPRIYPFLDTSGYSALVESLLIDVYLLGNG